MYDLKWNDCCLLKELRVYKPALEWESILKNVHVCSTCACSQCNRGTLRVLASLTEYALVDVKSARALLVKHQRFVTQLLSDINIT